MLRNFICSPFLFTTLRLRDCSRHYAGRKVFRPENLANFGFALPTGPVLPMKFHEALRAFDGFLFGFEVENGEAADDFLRLSERAISGLQLSASDANVRARLGWRETAGGDHCAGFVRLLGKLVDGVHQSFWRRPRE